VVRCAWIGQDAAKGLGAKTFMDAYRREVAHDHARRMLAP